MSQQQLVDNKRTPWIMHYIHCRYSFAGFCTAQKGSAIGIHTVRRKKSRPSPTLLCISQQQFVDKKRTPWIMNYLHCRYSFAWFFTAQKGLAIGIHTVWGEKSRPSPTLLWISKQQFVDKKRRPWIMNYFTAGIASQDSLLLRKARL